MAITNNNDFVLTITGKELHNPNKHASVELEILAGNALMDSSGLLLAFKNEYGEYLFHNGTHAKSEVAQKILDAAQKAFPYAAAVTAGGYGAAAGLTVNKNTAVAGGIIGVILGLSVASIVDVFDKANTVQEGYYCAGNLIYPDKIYLTLS